MYDRYGLIGEKLSHSYSPIIHREILKRIERNGEYSLIEVEKDKIKNITLDIRENLYKGVNVTIPYKIEVIKYLDKLSDEAKEIGAVNTISKKDNMLIGYNTDYFGFGKMLDLNGVNIKNKNATILGTGGAARAVIYYLKNNNIKDITIVTRNIEKAQREFRDYRSISYEELSNLKQQDLLINCTPIGMYPNINNSPVEEEVLKNYDVAIDLIYNPTETVFLRYAKNNSIKAIDGLYMLVAQAVKSQEIWNNIKIEDRVIREVYDVLEDILIKGEQNG